MVLTKNNGENIPIDGIEEIDGFPIVRPYEEEKSEILSAIEAEEVGLVFHDEYGVPDLTEQICYN